MRLTPAGWFWIPYALAAIFIVLYVHTASFNDELQVENARLHAENARKIEPPNLVNPIHPDGIVLLQRCDKRHRDGTIRHSKWRENCK
jgi:hypothetical protein